MPNPSMRETCRSILHHVIFDIANSLLFPPFIAHNCSITNFTSKLTYMFCFFRFNLLKIGTFRAEIRLLRIYYCIVLPKSRRKKQEENKKEPTTI